MNRVFLIMAVLALQVLARDKIIEARKNSTRKLDAAEAARVYAALKDEELIEELIQLRNSKAKLPMGDADRLFQYGLDKELVDRARKSEPLQKELLSRLEDNTTPSEIRQSAVRHFWKFRQKPEQVEADEALLRKVHAVNPGDQALRIDVLKKLNTTSETNIAFLGGVARKASDDSERNAAVNRLGKLGLKAGKEGRKDQEARIWKELLTLRTSGRISLAQLSMARNFSDTKEGRSYLKDELAKEGFRDWQEVLFAVKADAGYENVRRAHGKAKFEKTLPRDEAVLRELAKSNIAGFRDGEGLKDSEAKKDFLELRTLMLDDPSVPSADSAVVGLLSDEDVSVRMAAVEATHYGLKDNHRILSALLKSEKDGNIRKFLQTRGYAE